MALRRDKGDRLLDDISEQVITFEDDAPVIDLDLRMIPGVKIPPAQLVHKSAVVERPTGLLMIGTDKLSQVRYQGLLLGDEGPRAETAMKGMSVVRESLEVAALLVGWVVDESVTEQ
jgi:hypothetical protein